MSALGKSARRVLDSEVRGMTVILDRPVDRSARQESVGGSFRFSDVNPLAGVPFAESLFEDLPDCVARVVAERFGFGAGEWDVLVEDCEVIDFVDPGQGFPLDAVSAGRLRAASLPDGELVAALTLMGAELPPVGASAGTVLDAAAWGLSQAGDAAVREIGRTTFYLRRVGNTRALAEIFGSADREQRAHELARGLDVRSALRTRPVTVDTITVIA